MTSRGFLVLTLLAAACAGTAGCAAPQVPPDQVRRFRADISVQEDDALTVREELTVSITGRQVQHGIWREFPLYTYDCEGQRRPFDFEVLDVLRDGQPADHFVRRIPGATWLYIGERDRLLKPGDHTYAITYRTGPLVQRADGGCRLCWEATGVGWAFEIVEASVTVRLPRRVPTDDVALEGSVQPAEPGEQLFTGIDEEGRLIWRTRNPLSPGQRFSVKASWRESESVPLQ